jgi:hypothetical protein
MKWGRKLSSLTGPKLWDIIRLRKEKNYVNKRSTQNHRRAVEAIEDAWPGVQPASCCMYYRRQVGEGPRQRLRWLLCIEGPVQVQERPGRITTKAASVNGPAMGSGHDCLN